MAEGEYLLSDVLGAEADSCAGESQGAQWDGRTVSHTLPCDLLPADGAARLMHWPQGLSSAHSSWHHQPSPQHGQGAAWSWLVVSVGVSMGESGYRPSLGGAPHLEPAGVNLASGGRAAAACWDGMLFLLS